MAERIKRLKFYDKFDATRILNFIINNPKRKKRLKLKDDILGMDKLVKINFFAIKDLAVRTVKNLNWLFIFIFLSFLF